MIEGYKSKILFILPSISVHYFTFCTVIHFNFLRYGWVKIIYKKHKEKHIW